MLYYLYLINEASWAASPLRVLRYITVRTVAAAGTSFIISLVLGPYVIRKLREFKIGQYVRHAGEMPDLYKMHSSKQGTPTMGGLLIILAITISTFLWSSLDNTSVWLILATLWYLGLVGFWDDYTSLINKRSKGIKSRIKFLLQFVWAVAIAWVLNCIPEKRELMRQFLVPFIKDPVVQDMGLVYAMIMVSLIIVGSSNAVNLTDGLDGLATGCSSSVALSYLIMSYAAGHIAFATYLNIPYVGDGGEIAIICGSLLGACLGFLWYNCYPAQVFMGDTGSLALGGVIAVIAVLIKQEIALVIVGGIFVIEALSVILQVFSFRVFGRRILAMAPIHHHFEMKKWSETQVTIRFWIVSIIFAMLGILTLKIR